MTAALDIYGPGQRWSALPTDCRQLVRFICSIGFGKIFGLHVRDGKPVLSPRPRIEHEVKFGHIGESRPSLRDSDFILKAEQRELLALFARIGTGIIGR